MNQQDTELPPSDALPQSETPAPKVRRRKPVAVAVDVDPSTSSASEAAPPEAEAAVVAPRRRSRKAAVETSGEAIDVATAATNAGVKVGVVESVAAGAADIAPRLALPAAASIVPSSGGIEGESVATDTDTDTVATDTTESTPAAHDQPAAEGDAPRRSRKRRRGRRGDDDRSLASGAPEVQRGDAANPSSGQDGTSAARPPRREPLPSLPRADVTETFADVLSGAYDASAEAAPDGATEQEPTGTAAEGVEAPGVERRVLAAEPDAPKLHKLLAQSGIGSRRDMEQLIEDGQVTVNEQPAHVGQRISFGDQVKVQGRLVKLRIAPAPARVLAYHKPTGEVVTHDDPQNRPTVFRRLPRLPHGKWQSVGRLDINTEGLLLFTNSGDLANQLMHPRFGVEREYAVRVLGTLDKEAKARLLEGVDIEGQRAAFKSIDDGGGEGVNHWYRVVITEGRNREVRKLFDKVGLGVSRLIRIRYGGVVLPKGLKRGVFVDLNELEVRELRRLAGGREPAPVRQEAPRADTRGDADRGPRKRQRGRPDRPTDRSPDRAQDRGQDRAQDRPPGRAQDRMPPRGGDRSADASVQARDPYDDIGPIPNPLQQTFDKRAIREARQPRREYSEDGPIPNPLEQTYDKRFVQKPRGGDGRSKRGGEGGPGGGQPDPMKTALGYIGADAFVRKFQGNGGGGGGGGGGGRSGGGGGRRRGGGR